jgi:hypothetical protein
MTMPKYQFVATHGVQFGDSTDDGLAVWAHFTVDDTLDTPEGQKRYTFATDDAKVAQRVRAVKDYGITETSVPSKAAPADE